METLGIFTHFDKQLQIVSKLSQKKKILLNMFLIECKYNVEILDLIKADFKNNEDKQIHELINLLSINGIERIISEKDNLSGDSFLLGLGNNLIEKLKITDKANKDNDIENIEDSFVLNIYKRMLVLKAISQLTKPYTTVREINILVRLRHLKELLLIISKCTIN